MNEIFDKICCVSCGRSLPPNQQARRACFTCRPPEEMNSEYLDQIYKDLEFMEAFDWYNDKRTEYEKIREENKIKNRFEILAPDPLTLSTLLQSEREYDRKRHKKN